MFKISAEYRSISTKVYSFAILCLSTKWFSFSIETQGGLTLTVQDPAVVSGALGFMTLFLTIACLSRLIVDGLMSRLSDDARLSVKQDYSSFRQEDANKSSDETFAARHYVFVRWAFVTWFVIEAMVPVCLGIATSWISLQDMVTFGRFVAFGGA